MRFDNGDDVSRRGYNALAQDNDSQQRKPPHQVSFGETKNHPVVGNEKGHGNLHNRDDAPCEKDKVIAVSAMKGKGNTKINDGGNYVQACLSIERNMSSLEATDKPQSAGVLSC